LLKKVVTGVMLALLLTGSLMFAFNVRPVKGSWTGNVYIRADGSIEPPDAPLSTVDKVTYVFTGNVYGGIVVKRSNIIIEGNGYAIQGRACAGSGVYLSSVHNVTIKNITITRFYYGVLLDSYSNYNSISGNNIRKNSQGIRSNGYNNNIFGNNIANNYQGIHLGPASLFSTSTNNDIFGNNITENAYGIYLYYSNNNHIYHNNFINNAEQVYSYKSVNVWDAGYPSGGNYWSDYTGVDEKNGPNQDQPGSDGIGDKPYVIDADNQDNYPLMIPWGAMYWYPSEYVKPNYKIASFDRVEDWVWRNCIPLLLLNTKSHFSLLKPPLAPPSFPPDADTKLQDPDHRPDWCYRVIVDESNRRFVVQLIGNWTYQYAGIDVCSFLVGEHPWDYEPIFLYYSYSGDDFYSSLENGEVEYDYVFHTVWHGYVDTLAPLGDGTDADAPSDDEKLFFWEDNEGRKHPVFVIGKTHEIGGTMISTEWLTSWAGHAYGHVRRKGYVGIDVLYPVTGEDIVDWKFEWSSGYEGFWPENKNFDQDFKDQHLVRLTDDVIANWESRSENPFKMTPLFGSQDLIDPWNENYKDEWPSVGEKFDPVEILPRTFCVLVGSPTMLYITDPEGRHIGVDPSTGEVVNEIPEASYNVIEERFQSVTILNALTGNYDIMLLGNGVGNFTAMTTLLVSSGIIEQTYSGIIFTGQVLTISAILANETLTSNTPARLPASATDKLSVTQYIKLEMEWLTTSLKSMNIEEDVKESLLDKLTNATLKVDQAINWINLNREKQANNMLNSVMNIMNAFLNQVYAQESKALSELYSKSLIITSQGIVEDVETAKEKNI